MTDNNKPGRRKLWIFWSIIVLLILLGIILFSFHKQNRPGNINGSKNISASVEVTRVSNTNMSRFLTAYGITSIAPGKIRQMTTQIEVLVQKIFVSNGQHINEGDPLIELSITENTLKHLEQAKIDMEFAKKDLDRLENLRTQYLATNKDVQGAQKTFEDAEANYNILKNEIENETGNIQKSPCTCNIITVNVQPGQIISAGTTMLTYAETNEVIVRLGVEYEDLSKIHVNQKVIITPIYNSKIQYTGKIGNITNEINPQSGLIDVIVPLGQAADLINGSMVKGDILLEQSNTVLAIPASAILYEKNQPYVYVDNNGIAEKRYIKAGKKFDDKVEVLGGLDEGEIIVTLGNYELSNGMKLTTTPQ